MDDHGEDEIDDGGPFTEALAASQAAQTAYEAALPDLTHARRQFSKLRTPEAETEMERQDLVVQERTFPRSEKSQKQADR
jgi:hypothetical protein